MPWNVRDGRERCANNTGRENSWRETQYAQFMILVGLEKIVERSERIGRRPYRFDKSTRYWRVWIIKSDGPEMMGLFTWRVLGNSRSDSFCRKSDVLISRSWWMKVKTRRQETNSKLEWGWTSVTGNLTRNMDYLPILMKDTESIGSPPEACQSRRRPIPDQKGARDPRLEKQSTMDALRTWQGLTCKI